MTLKNPQQNMEDLERALAAWRQFAPDKKYGGYTLEQFEAFVIDSRKDRSDLVINENEGKAICVRRDNHDEIGLTVVDKMVEGVVYEEGKDSAFYQALGYKLESEYKSGLTRKHNDDEDDDK